MKFRIPAKKVSGFLYMLMLLTAAMVAPAQQSNTLFLMHSVPQSNQLNPAVQLRCKYFVGIPVLNTLHFNYSNTSFTFNDIANESMLELDKVYDFLDRKNGIFAEAIAYPVSLGYRMGDRYFTFSVADKFSTYNSFSKKLAGLLLYGNYPEYVGDPQRFDNTRVNASYYREYSAGYAFFLDKYTRAGVRAKLLFGKANINTGSSRVLLGTDPVRFDLTVAGNVQLNSSLPIVIEQGGDSLIRSISFQELNYFSLLMNPRNVGVAADFGIISEFSDEISLSASILDLGVVRYTHDTYNVGSEVDFFYAGASEGTDFSTAAYFRDLTDSIMNDIKYGVTQESYFAPLPLQVFLGAEIRWSRDITLGLVNRNVLVNRRISSSLTASLNAVIRKHFRASVSLSHLNNTIMNFGAGLAYTGDNFQVYAVSDNVYGLFKPLDVRTVNIRFGMNFMLGCPLKPGKVHRNRNTMLSGKCAWMENKTRRKRNIFKRW
ncbi:MAG: DUF5723 family protein [Bacteroidales bacterium]|nr:DUF5723 family protein [Bacteroidales bacterium]